MLLFAFDYSSPSVHHALIRIRIDSSVRGKSFSAPECIHTVLKFYTFFTLLSSCRYVFAMMIHVDLMNDAIEKKGRVKAHWKGGGFNLCLSSAPA